MRSKKLDISGILKQGLMPDDPGGNSIGLASLKNLRTDGSMLAPCFVETVTKINDCTPFSLGILDYYLTATGIYKQGTGLVYSYTFVGRVKIVNLIKVVYIQDDVKTIFVDLSGIYLVNPSGDSIPLSNALVNLDGQLIAGGIVSGLVGGVPYLDQGYVAWSGIGSSSFEISKINDAGFYNPDIGLVYDVLPLKESAIVLGSNGSSLMSYAETTFGFKRLDLPRLKSKGLCASSQDFALYITQDGSIIKVDRSGKPENLNFAWIGKDVVSVRYLRGRNLFLFTTASMSYLLDSQGMFSYGYKVFGEFSTSLVVSSTFEQTSWTFQTSFNDLGKAGLKTLLEIYIKDGLGSQARLAQAFSETLSITQGTKTLNSLSACKYPLVGSNIAIGYSSAISPKISSLQVEIIDTDKRFGSGYTPGGFR